MIAFLVATPYQLLSSMQIRTQAYGDEPADIYLLTFNVDMGIYAGIIKRSGIYENVYVTFEPYDKIGKNSSPIQRMREFVFPKSKIAQILQKKRYDILFSTCIGLGNPYFYNLLKNNNPKIHFMYYDEGMGDYAENPYRKQGRFDAFRKMLGYEDPTQSKLDGIWLYQPSWKVPKSICPVYQISPLNKDCIAAKLLAPNQQLPSMEVIYLDAPWSEEMNFHLDYSLLNELIEKYGLYDKLWVKLHPTQTKAEIRHVNSHVYPLETTPWELQYLCDTIKSAVLISICSTAAVSPKMLYDIEPTVILLYKLYAAEYPVCKEEHDSFFKKVQLSYKGRNFFIPNTWEEAEQIFAQIASNVKENSNH